MNYNDLKNLVQHHCRMYYDLNNPEISDKEFDSLYDSLEEIETKQGWWDADSPTRKVGGQAGKVKHTYPLYSLKKVYSAEEIPAEYTIKTPKLDGANLTIYYDEQGKLVRLVTRGNGTHGEDITFLAPYIKGIPDSVIMLGKFVVNGECMTDNLNAPNYRNYVSGALGQLNIEEFKTRNIVFIAHTVLGINIDYDESMYICKDLGFITVIDKDLPDYPTDGLVFQINNKNERQKLGYTNKHPRFALALKPQAEEVETTLLDIEWSIGRSGVITPVGIVEPVIVDNATITRVTLHNLKYIWDNNLGLGDTIAIERRGGVIPKFVRVVERTDSIRITPENVDSGYEAVFDGIRLILKEFNAEQDRKQLENFIKNMEIKGLGPASLDKTGINSIFELYDYNNWDILGANGKKVKYQVELSKTKPFTQVLGSLGIPGVGLNTAKLICAHISNIDDLINLPKIKGIGDSTIASIKEWYDAFASEIKQLPLQLSGYPTIIATKKDNGKQIAITGKLDKTKNELTTILESFGYTVKDTVTKSTYALICDNINSTSSKAVSARKYEVKIIDYFADKEAVLEGKL